MRPASATLLAAAHRRFARAALLIYVGAGLLASAMLSLALYTDRSHEERDLRQNASLQTRLRAEYLGEHLALLAKELQRFGLHSHANLLGSDLSSIQNLLSLSHERSSFFNTGIAIIGADGRVLWSLPSAFLKEGTSFADRPWFSSLAERRRARFVPVDPNREQDSLLYVVSPIVRDERLVGALLGAVDLAKDGVIEPEPSGGPHRPMVMLATYSGQVVYPPRPPAFAAEPSWRSLFEGQSAPRAVSVDRQLAGRSWLVTAAPVHGTRMSLVVLYRHDLLLGPARSRLLIRLLAGLAVVLAALGLLVPMLIRSLKIFRRAEMQAAHEEEMHRLGEATNLIAHEVKNALNGMRLGIDVLLRSGKRDGTVESRSAQIVRDELQRLSAFTDELLIFSKGVVPRPAPLDLAAMTRSVDELMQVSARDLQVQLELDLPDGELPLHGDPRLLRVVVTNLVMNALEAASAGRAQRSPKVLVKLFSTEEGIELQVSDSGPGVPVSVRDRLFEPFVTGKPSGVGIGLALSRRIALAHGGDLRLVSFDPTCFAFSIPRGSSCLPTSSSSMMSLPSA